MTSEAIRTTGLTKRFGQLTAVDHLDLTVRTGEVVALLGPNGAGKSTTTEMILGLNRPDEGAVKVLGTDPITAMRAGGVGAMLQGGPLLDGVSVRGLLRLMAGLHRHPLPLAEVIERADLTEVLHTPTTKLSGGQAQRVRFALAILADPRLLLLDEPTVAMDVSTRREFWSQMRGIADQGRTIVFATHYLDEADEFAQRVIVMTRGRVVADGTGAQIKRRVAGRVVSFRSEDSSDQVALESLAGVTGATRVGDRIQLRTTDSDATLYALLELPERVNEIEVSAVSLEDAFIELTHQAA
ncbi:ABC transporter ATP-binding protein [Enemella dayhoffiae]|uniref:ABC transporter ATP-binding protein n=1 Tax=Enemella dayhoffiae TaxID=2016507 RepID=A0A255GYL7_9ACTN|nr:ABC transporter ATP-binding protein [Enemella dayhoffiae]OYO20755.1 ABC transporter ATP-binding protein [Enemella dayhoffiae]